jgi:hypothetical protein
VALRLARNLDLVLLLLALPVFLAASLPVLGWGVGTGIYVAQRIVRDLVVRRASRSDDPRTVAGLMAGSMLFRGMISALTLLVIGLTHRHSGLAATLLFLAAFTLATAVGLVLRPLDRRIP